LKLSASELQVLNLVRQLDRNQRKHLLDELNGQVLANDVTAKISKVKRVRTSPDHRVAQVDGLPSSRTK